MALTEKYQSRPVLLPIIFENAELGSNVMKKGIRYLG
jgi:hypothetical protein